MVFSSEPYKTGILLTKSSPGIYDLEYLLTLLDVIFGVTSLIQLYAREGDRLKEKLIQSCF